MEIKLILPDNHHVDSVVAVLKEALECHVNGLKEATEAATTDRTLESPEELMVVTGSMSEDISIAEMLLEVFNVPADR
jgi:hypothetical protein